MSSVGSNSIVNPGRPAFLILASTGAAGRKSATAADMISASRPGRCSLTARAMSAALSTSTGVMPGSVSAAAVVTSVTSAPRSRAAAAKARPIRPDERLVRVRTGSTASRVPPAVTSMERPAKSPCAPSAWRRAG